MNKKTPKLYAERRPKKSRPKKKSGLWSWIQGFLGRSTASSKTSQRSKSRKKRSRLRAALVKFFLICLTWGTSIGLLGILWFSYDLPDVQRLQATTRRASVTIQALDGTILGTYGDLFEDFVRISELPPYVGQAVMAIEDRRYYNHFGVDFIGLLRAAYINYRAQRIVQGGSTLTQQLAKNFLQTQGMYKVHDRSFRRKIQEAIMALWLEWTFTKEQILTMYLNRVYFGAGAYGVEAAAQKYFNKSARHLSVYEAAAIAGLLKAPSRYSPTNNPQKSHDRAVVVLRQMLDAGVIHDIESHIQQPESGEEATIHLEGARFFADWVYETIPSLIGGYSEDLVVSTTFDPQIQEHAERACQKLMTDMGKTMKTTELALVSMMPNGAVKAMVGGMNYRKSQYNRATQALRQPGSAFKPFVYLAAIEAGLTPEQLIEDGPVTLGKWSPKNFRSYKSQGLITLEVALIQSVNTATARIAAIIGGKKIADVARRLGIMSDMSTDLSICLGSMEVTLLDLVSGFATFANEGRSVWPHGVVEIRNRKGDILYQREDDLTERVIKPHDVATMNRMLCAVVERGTARGAKLSIPVAGKTGSNADKDAWFVGYTADLVTGVWTGNDHNAPMHRNSTGGRIPARVFSAFMTAVLQDYPPMRTLGSLAAVHTSPPIRPDVFDHPAIGSPMITHHDLTKPALESNNGNDVENLLEELASTAQ